MAEPSRQTPDRAVAGPPGESARAADPDERSGSVLTAPDDAAAGPPEAPARRGLLARTALLARRHLGLLVLLAVASVARAVVVLAYPSALWFPDSGPYLNGAMIIRPAVDRPFGYSAFLGLTYQFLSFRGIAVLQHVLGLIMVVVLYALLQHRGVPRWISLLAAVPLALDAYVLDIEHFLLAETLFMFGLTLAIALLLWRDRPGPLLVGTVGLLGGALAITRTLGTALIGILLVYLLLRVLLRTLRWTTLVGFGLGVAVLLVPYSAWFASVHGSYALTDFTGHFLYGRVADFVQCEKLDMPARLQPLCPPGAPQDRPTGDAFVWWSVSPANAEVNGVKVWSEADLEEFSLIAIKGQPVDYLQKVLSEMGHYVTFGRHSGPQDTCPLWWRFPLPVLEPPTTCIPVLAPTPPLQVSDWNLPLVDGLRSYQQFGYIPGPLLGLCAVAGLAALLVPGGRARERLDPGLLAVLGVAVIAVPAVTASFDYRYLLPTLVVLPAAAALAVRRLPVGRRSRDAVSTPV
jgi:hypothetical protein